MRQIFPAQEDMEQHTTKKVSGEKRGRPSLSAEETAEQNRLRLSASFRTTMHHKAGSTLKKYSVLREFALSDELGRGGYATVFLGGGRGENGGTSRPDSVYPPHPPDTPPPAPHDPARRST